MLNFFRMHFRWNPSLPEPRPGRAAASLDALRGFDMFWIARAVRSAPGYLHRNHRASIARRLTQQFEHVQWNGFRFEDLIFPLFVFMAGVSLPFSLGRRMEQGEPKSRIYARIARRVVGLVVLGLIFNELLQFHFAHMGAIPACWGGSGWLRRAALIMLHISFRGRLAWLAALLLGYWALMTRVPVPELRGGKPLPRQEPLGLS